MAFTLLLTPLASAQLTEIEKDLRKYRKVRKCLGLIERDPLYPGLRSHRYAELDQLHGEKIWESYVENRAPGAFRVFWHYGPGQAEITVVAITPHP
ncbi:MAG: hypothetical protein HYR64_07265 [Fimbriimonas ginsengisoli]|uniref:Uncharacterized protein n=1 Tax=Fimbriimonas ginsengisoli TaxID=1005039 RepID=A0A931LVE9_FIMGI|nr:hypothetical protein [Fimbriimonas ginsengisoli]